MQNLPIARDLRTESPFAFSSDKYGREPRRQTDAAAARVLTLVARQRRVPEPLLLHGSRCRASIAEARQVAMYLTHVVLRRSYAEVADLFGRDRTTVSHACARIEDMRDVPAFDTELVRLELAIAGAGLLRERADATE